MALQLYFGVRLPERSYERVPVKDASPTMKTIELKLNAHNMLQLSHPNKELEFIYCGRVLEDDQTLGEQGVRTGSTIHVFQKEPEFTPRDLNVTDEQIDAATASYGCYFTKNCMHKPLRAEVIRMVLEEYPEFHQDLGAFAILKDSLLLHRIATMEFARTVADCYPLLIVSAPFVVKTMIAHNKLVARTQPQSSSFSSSIAAGGQPLGEESLSDESSTSEGDSPTASPNHSDIRRISRGQLSTALLLAGTSSANSLANIANEGGGGGGVAGGSSTGGATTSMAEPPTTPSTSGGATAPPTRISNSLFSNALSQAFLDSSASANATPMDVTSSSATDSLVGAQREQYASEMMTMYEMGLTDAATNLQALIIFNGNVQEAVNLVLTGMSGFS